MFTDLRRILFGDPLPTASETEQRLTKIKALAVFSSDALSSVAYATEEILLVLVLAGTGYLYLSIPIALAIAALAIIVAISYYQTVHGYPSGGGAYVVAEENLGKWPGLIAAAALLNDYVLTVAVSMTAGIAAITSAFPSLFSYRVELCVLGVVLITWANLRGVKESGTIFAIPTYCFIIILLALIAVGVFRLTTGSLSPDAGQLAVFTENDAEPLTLFLLMRAFASGCTALTGIEAVSNGVPAFKKPEARNAGITLIAMAVLLTTTFLGTTFLANVLQVIPSENETVVSQIGRYVFDGGLPYLFLQFATSFILVLAANTSFNGFPRLAAILAQARYLPNQLTSLGDRLAFNNGIFALAVSSVALIVIFGGDTHRLIPLYAVGVFLSFTLSQAGMVRHWQKERGNNWQWKAAINSLGAAATGIVMLVILAAKFIHGAWIVALLIPLFVWIFHTIKHYYALVARQLSLEGLEPEAWDDVDPQARHKIVVPVSGMHRGSLAALHFARVMSADVTAVMVDVEPERTARVREKWQVWGHGVPLVVLESPYRSVIQPLLAYLEEADQREPERGLAVVVLPEFVPPHWWNHLFHNQTAILFKAILTYQRGKTGKGRVVINVPYHLERR
ncbi:MAG: APC family permease [Anaerolineae bacterium]|nr:APC family permease [Anaerolineae bacterium]